MPGASWTSALASLILSFAPCKLGVCPAWSCAWKILLEEREGRRWGQLTSWWWGQKCCSLFPFLGIERCFGGCAVLSCLQNWVIAVCCEGLGVSLQYSIFVACNQAQLVATSQWMNGEFLSALKHGWDSSKHSWHHVSAITSIWNSIWFWKKIFSWTWGVGVLKIEVTGLLFFKPEASSAEPGWEEKHFMFWAEKCSRT